ncbi:MAG: ATP-binding protein [Oscillospiraceae bacterium]|nr:ATP-binding protein [Oscillospiraceae bacterium]
MKGKISFSIKNRQIAFKFVLERNITILTGDSGTGKTKLINMVRNYSREGKASGITLKCDKPCIVLDDNNWDIILQRTSSSIVFVEESTRFLSKHEFAKAIADTDNYYVFVTREPLPQIPYSIDAIKQMIRNDSKPKIEKLYGKVSVNDISGFPYDVVIVEDSKAGFLFFTNAAGKWDVKCETANGKSNILTVLKKRREGRILVIADAAALGSEISELMRFKSLSNKKIDLFLPESFEWLILKSAVFGRNANVKEILNDPAKYIESKEYFSWERYFTALLVKESKNRENLKYPANKRKLPSGYLTDTNMENILNAMK